MAATTTETIRLIDCPVCGEPIEMHATYDTHLDQSTDASATENPDTTVSESPCTECERLRGVVHAQEIAINGYREAAVSCAAPAWRDALEWAAQHIFVNNGQTTNARRWLQAAAGSVSGIAEVRDGLPIVRTVGDLTARHVGRRVRLDEHYDGTLETIFAHGGYMSLNFTHPEGFAFGCSRPLDTPCEVLS